MDSGFPHHRDSWVSTAATSWAVMALMQVLPPGAASGKPTTDRKDPPVRPMPELAKVDFAAQVKPLLERSCAACHTGERPRGMFRVDSRDALLKGGESGTAAVVAGLSSKSPLVDYVSDRVPESEMPPKATRAKFPRLSKDEVALLRAWIDQGAEWPKDVTLTLPKSDK
jgi:mono/diheme cytochrome c family protein